MARKHKCDGCQFLSTYDGDAHFRPIIICTKGCDIIEAEKLYNAEQCPFSPHNLTIDEIITGFSAMEQQMRDLTETFEKLNAAIDAWNKKAREETDNEQQ